LIIALVVLLRIFDFNSRLSMSRCHQILILPNLYPVLSLSIGKEHCIPKVAQSSEAIQPPLEKEKAGSKNLEKSAPTASSAQVKAANAKKMTEEKRILSAISEIRAVLATKPKGLSGVRKMCLALREIVLTVADLNTLKARLGLLADVLALWAHTTNFSSIQEYNVVESDPIPVVARELGNNISRIKILKPETRTIKRRGKEESTVPEGIIEIEGSSAEDLSLLAEEAYALRESEGDAEDCAMVIQCDTHVDVVTDSEPDSLSSSISSASTSASSSFRRGKDSSSESVVAESSSGTDSEGRSVKTEGSDLSDAASITEDTIVYFENEKREKQKEEEMKIKKEEAKNMLSSDADPVPSDSVPKSEKNKPNHKEANASHTYMDPNEPVYMGSKTYGKLFVFWQLIGWFNAGSDQRVEAPDLFGCVQLPLPAACFGVSESVYGPKQREALIAHLREEKAQSMPWPPSIKACFNSAHLSARVDGRSLVGSPMLDGALGQVDSVTKAMEVLCPLSLSSSSHNGKTDTSQFDSILPPEVPTSWVQCESCRKWRRVAWHVDQGSLPDLWECGMNDWEPENASCDVPQDSYDPERESTLNYTSSEVHSDSEAFVLGTYRDVFCKKNKIYYEAQVKRLKEPKKPEDKLKILFHFKGWSPKFDEWIEAGSDRIRYVLTCVLMSPACSMDRLTSVMVT
jgi:CW-type Zinc Finger/Protein SET DOMAIN GROUP 2 C-terminal